jgi:hypothetical protein
MDVYIETAIMAICFLKLLKMVIPSGFYFLLQGGIGDAGVYAAEFEVSHFQNLAVFAT